MATIRNSPWAKLTISMRPKMRESPAAISAYTKPISTPPTRAWAISSSVSSRSPGDAGRRADRYLRSFHAGIG